MFLFPLMAGRAAVNISPAQLEAPARVSVAVLEGRVHWVVPSVLLPEGVHAGSLGPLYYPTDEIERSVAAWNYKPVVINHPTLNGQNVSACRPEVLNTRKIGVLLDARFENNKLKADAWVDRQRAAQIEPRVVEAIRAGRMMELSTGLYLDVEEVRGTWNGEEYAGIARNYRPDHLALLPDSKGAASIEDGAGFLRNQAAWNAALTAARQRLGDGVEPLDVTDDGLIVSDRDGRLWLFGPDSGADPQPVRPGKRYIALGAAGGAGPAARNQPAGGDRMSHDELIAALLEARAWSDGAKALLNAAPDEVLAELLAALKAAAAGGAGASGASGAGGAAESNRATAAANTAAANTAGAAPKGAGAPDRSEPSLEEYIAAAPEALRAVLNEALESRRAERRALIEAISAAPGNTFDAHELESFPAAQLRKLAALAANAKRAAQTPAPRKAAPFAAGDGGAPTVDNEPLPLPRLSARRQTA